MDPPVFLSLNQDLPQYCYSSFRQFTDGERHITRIAEFDVLLLILQGELNFLEDKRPVLVKEGEWYIQRAGRLQEGLPGTAAPAYFYIHFHGGFQSRSESALPLAGRFPIGISLPAFNRLDFAEQTQMILTERTRYFYEVLSLLYSTQQDEQDRLIVDIQLYLAANCNRRIRIADLARQFGYSADHIIRMFKKRFHITPYQYILKLRLSHAKTLLLTTDRPLAAVAEQAGFGDPVALFRAFQKDTGLSPKKWRQQKRALP